MKRRIQATKGRILYLLHIDWDWIKQRPHFLAEELSSEFDLLVAYPHAIRRSPRLVKNKTTLRRVPLLQLPLARFSFVVALNKRLRYLYCWILVLVYRPDIVWVAFPTVVPKGALKRFKNVLVVYDCMDDAAEFVSDGPTKNQIEQRERELLERADLVCVSSQNLRQKILARGFGPQNLELVRNAYDGRDYSTPRRAAKPPGSTFKILYFGTISDYLDFDALLYCLERCERLEFDFVGPVIAPTPSHSGLNFLGPIEHSHLATLMQPYDCFIMPFKTNELIQGVDPVKLYEYINFDKNIICPFYDEIERFAEFVAFYRSQEELVSVVRSLQHDNEIKYSEDQRRLFLQDNNWKIRGAAVSAAIKARL